MPATKTTPTAMRHRRPLRLRQFLQVALKFLHAGVSFRVHKNRIIQNKKRPGRRWGALARAFDDARSYGANECSLGAILARVWRVGKREIRKRTS